MKNLINYTFAVLTLVAMIFGATQIANANVSGIQRVTASQNGRQVAIYVNYSRGAWLEVGTQSDGSFRKFRETGRDANSIYLSDSVASLQLDFHTRQINYEDTSGQRISGLYAITSGR